MNRIEAKIKELELGLTVTEDKNPLTNKPMYTARFGNIGLVGHNTEPEAWDWIAKEFNLMNLVPKDKIRSIMDNDNMLLGDKINEIRSLVEDN